MNHRCDYCANWSSKYDKKVNTSINGIDIGFFDDRIRSQVNKNIWNLRSFYSVEDPSRLESPEYL